MNPGVGVETGFNGCIADISLGKKTFGDDLGRAVVEAANVNECGARAAAAVCEKNTCGGALRGKCVASEGGYSCLCRWGHGGQNCTQEVDVSATSGSKTVVGFKRNGFATLRAAGAVSFAFVASASGERRQTIVRRGHFALELVNSRVEAVVYKKGRRSLLAVVQLSRSDAWTEEQKHRVELYRSGSEGFALKVDNGKEIVLGEVNKKHLGKFPVF